MDNADIQTVEITSVDKETATMERLAYECARALTTAYPNYPWMVGWAPGAVLVVKLLINPDSNYGYTIDAGRLNSTRELARLSRAAGGELLERLGMRRGVWNGEMPTQNMEGVPADKATPIYLTNNVKGVEG